MQPTLQGDFQCQCVSQRYLHHLAAQRAPPPLCAPRFSRDNRVNPPRPRLVWLSPLSVSDETVGVNTFANHCQGVCRALKYCLNEERRDEAMSSWFKSALFPLRPLPPPSFVMFQRRSEVLQTQLTTSRCSRHESALFFFFFWTLTSCHCCDEARAHATRKEKHSLKVTDRLTRDDRFSRRYFAS